MLQSTHQRIAMHLTETWSEDMLRLCSVDDFIHGSTLPDRFLPLRLMTHGFPQSGTFVFSLLSSLIHKNLSPKQFGRRLGIVAHFVADYACAYHSNPRLKNRIVGHRAYERRIDSLPLPDERTGHATNLSSLWGELDQYVRTRHSRQSLEDPVRDLADAMFWVGHVVKLVFSAVLAKEEDRTTRVALFADTYYPHVNGVSNTIRRYSLHMTKQHVPHLLVVPSCKERSHAMEEGIPLLRVKSVSFPFYRGAMVALPNKRQINAVLDLLRPTVIHAMTEFVLGDYGLRYAKKRGIPFVSNYSTHYHMGIRHYRIGLVGAPLMRYLDNFHRQADLTTAPSSHAVEYLIKRGTLQPFLFGRGVDTTQFTPAKRSADLRNQWRAEDRFVYLYVGRLAGEKDLDVMLEAYASMSVVQRSLCRLVLVGDGPERSRLEKSYPEAIFMGTLSGEALHEAYASADCFVFPSPSETLGNVVLEAMASGLPVVCVNQGGVLDNVTDGVTGIVVEPKDVRAFRDAMTLLQLGGGTRKRLAHNGLKHAQSRSWQDVFAAMLWRYELLHRVPLEPRWFEDQLSCRIEHA